MAFDEDQRAEAIAAQWGVDVSLLEETDWEVEIIDGNDGEIYGYLVRFDDETDPDILTELGLRPGEFTRQLSINAFDEADYDRDDFESRHYTRRGRDNGYVEDRYVEDGYVGHDEPPVVPSSDSFAAFAGESFAEQAFAVRRASSAFVTADSGDITADNGVEPEVVTFRGEPVTHQGEPVTYTPRKADDGIYSMVYSTLDALRIAEAEPNRDVVFFAIGFETTTPPTALALKAAIAKGLGNFSIFCNHVLTPAAIQNILESPDVRKLGTIKIDGFIGPAHDRRPRRTARRRDEGHHRS